MERPLGTPATGSVAERLGYGAEDRLLIVNCDDLGSSHSANVATLRALTHGVATSATLMVPCPWAREAARLFAGLPVGIHLTLTAEHPGYRWRSLTAKRTLHDADGFSRPQRRRRWHASIRPTRAPSAGRRSRRRSAGVSMSRISMRT